MPEPVKRDYRSELRAAQAQETKRRIVAAAAELFVSQGYGSTSVDGIAAAAGVSRKTVFTSAGGKADLLALALDFAVAGDDEPVAVAQRPEVIALFRLDDPGALLDGWARVLAGIDARVGELFTALEAAASSDETARSVFERMQAQRRDGAQAVVDAVADLGALRDGITRSESVDVAWLLTEPVLYTRLVRDRGWSGRRFERWLADTLRQQLLRPPAKRSDSR